MLPNQEQPVLSRDQLTRYFERLQVPRDTRVYDVAGLQPEETLRYLALLQKLHLVEIPFENLSLHYSPHRQISIHPDELFRKIIADDNGRGGYCMENNTLFGALLRSLGYVLFSAGARVYVGSGWSGWSHMVNIVRIGTAKYHVDVGFGGNGPIVPMPLDRSESVQKNITPGAARLRFDNIPGNADPDQRLWIYEHRKDIDSEFEMTYCFTELEFLPSDYALMNYFTSTSPRSWFTRDVVAVKMMLGDDGDPAGMIILGHKDIKWRRYGKKERQLVFESESDRVNAIEEHFGIKLSQAEKDSIRGLASELK